MFDSIYDHYGAEKTNIMRDFTLNFQKKFISAKFTLSDSNKFFNIVNQITNREDIEVQNVFIAEIFEILTGREEILRVTMENINNEGKSMLKNINSLGIVMIDQVRLFMVRLYLGSLLLFNINK